MFEFVSKETWLKFNAEASDVKLETSKGIYPGNAIIRNEFTPTRSTSGSAGYDIRSPFSFTVSPGERVILPTGLKWNPKTYDNPNCVLQLYPRSSLGFKYGFTLLNTVGIIDADYYNNPDNEGHIMIGFTVRKEINIELGDKICQGIILPFMVSELAIPNKDRNGGIGSTGK